MAVLHSLKKELKMTEQEYHEIKNIIEKMEKEINSKGIFFNEQIKIGFYSHMVSFIRRLKKNDLVMDAEDNSILSQIEKENMNLAMDMTKALFQRYNTDFSKSEVILIAIYIQTSSHNKERG